MDRSLFKTDRPSDTLTATLHHLALGTPDPTTLAAFYQDALGYDIAATEGILGGTAQDRALLFVEGKAKTLAWAGYAVPDADELARLRARIDAAGWPRNDGPRPHFTDCVTVCDPDGNEFRFGIVADADPPRTRDASRPARIQHVVMGSQNPRRILSFFLDVLGFTLSDNVLAPDGDVRTSFLRCSREHHSFALFKAPDNRLDHHCYEATDWNAIRDWSDHLAERHIRLQWGPGRHGPGNNLFIFIHDPDGNWVEISAELEVVTHDRPVGEWPHAERTLNSWGQGLLRS